jgi:hypothetical protein
MTEMTKAQFLKHVGAMVNVSPTPLKVIGREACLQVQGPFRLSKGPRPKRHPNILWKVESKEIRDFMKVENGGVHLKNEHCTKQ